MTDSTRDSLAIVRRGYEEGWNQGRLRELLSQVRTAFPDVRREALDHVAQGDKIAVRWRVTGTHQGPFGGVPPTGRRVNVTGITIYRIKQGQIAEEWVQMDNAGLSRQLAGPGTT